ncbi:MAG: futalosine hydrolase [Bacteroidota bacterium]
MNLLLVAATRFEIEPLLKKFAKQNSLSFTINNIDVDVLLTEVGMVSAAIFCTKALCSKKYDFALQVGIAGAFHKELKIGEIVNITEDCIAELGAEDDDNFIPFTEMNLPGKNKFVNTTVFKNNVLQNIPQVNAITVNKVHGNEAAINKIWNLFHAYTESMEGAAFAQVCEEFKIFYAQIRSISNYVEKRNKNNWDISLAIENLNKKTAEILLSFNQ